MGADSGDESGALAAQRQRWVRLVLGGPSLINPSRDLGPAAFHAAASVLLSATPGSPAFESRLAAVLRDSGQPAIAQAIAEAMFVHFLGVDWLRAELKRATIDSILDSVVGTSRLPGSVALGFEQAAHVEPALDDALRPWQVLFVVRAAARVRALNPERRALVLREPAAMRATLRDIPTEGDADWQREVLLHLAAPDAFEPIGSPAVKEALAAAVALGADAATDVDARLARARMDVIRTAGPGPWQAAIDRAMWTTAHRRPTVGADRGFSDTPPSIPRRRRLLGDDRIPQDRAPAAVPSRRRGSAPGTPAEQQRRVVGIGFDSAERRVSIPASQPLRPATDYFLWFEIGVGAVAGAIRPNDPAPADLRPRDVLTVTVHSFPGEFAIAAGEDIGQLGVTADGLVVVRPASLPGSPRRHPRRGRLFFRVRTMERVGTARIRVNLYRSGLLLQSRLVSVRIATRRTSGPAARVDLDYTLTDEPLRFRSSVGGFSILVNRNDDATHGFRILGDINGTPAAATANVAEGEISNALTQARVALRKAAWGNGEEWDTKADYLFAPPRSRERLRGALVAIARAGFRLHSSTLGGLDVDNPRRFMRDLSRSSRIQVAHTDGAGLYFPAGVLYDLRLDPDQPEANYALCPQFLGSLGNDDPLESTSCFMGDHQPGLTVVCPAGFWGYRHDLSFPYSVGKGEVAAVIRIDGEVPALAAHSTDPKLAGWPDHWRRLKAIPGMTWQEASERANLFSQLGRERFNLVYFYCHGGLDIEQNLPYLEIGAPNSGYITPPAFDSYEIAFDGRSVVFINGCHTTAVTPDQAVQFVRTLVRSSRAAAVIGTEITIFEPLATEFGLRFIERFVGGADLDTAIRRSRLDLLRLLDPLGLVYIPFGLGALHIDPGREASASPLD